LTLLTLVFAVFWTTGCGQSWYPDINGGSPPEFYVRIVSPLVDSSGNPTSVVNDIQNGGSYNLNGLDPVSNPILEVRFKSPEKPGDAFAFPDYEQYILLISSTTPTGQDVGVFNAEVHSPADWNFDATYHNLAKSVLKDYTTYFGGTREYFNFAYNCGPDQDIVCSDVNCHNTLDPVGDPCWINVVDMYTPIQTVLNIISSSGTSRPQCTIVGTDTLNILSDPVGIPPARYKIHTQGGSITYYRLKNSDYCKNGLAQQIHVGLSGEGADHWRDDFGGATSLDFTIDTNWDQSSFFCLATGCGNKNPSQPSTWDPSGSGVRGGNCCGPDTNDDPDMGIQACAFCYKQDSQPIAGISQRDYLPTNPPIGNGNAGYCCGDDAAGSSVSTNNFDCGNVNDARLNICLNRNNPRWQWTGTFMGDVIKGVDCLNAQNSASSLSVTEVTVPAVLCGAGANINPMPAYQPPQNMAAGVENRQFVRYGKGVLNPLMNYENGQICVQDVNDHVNPSGVSVAECCGTDPNTCRTTPSASSHKTAGQFVTMNSPGSINAVKFYCLTNGSFSSDLDRDSLACSLAGYSWTGSMCCGEQEDSRVRGHENYVENLPAFKHDHECPTADRLPVYKIMQTNSPLYLSMIVDAQNIPGQKTRPIGYICKTNAYCSDPAFAVPIYELSTVPGGTPACAWNNILTSDTRNGLPNCNYNQVGYTCGALTYDQTCITQENIKITPACGDIPQDILATRTDIKPGCPNTISTIWRTCKSDYFYNATEVQGSCFNNTFQPVSSFLQYDWNSNGGKETFYEVRTNSLGKLVGCRVNMHDPPNDLRGGKPYEGARTNYATNWNIPAGEPFPTPDPQHPRKSDPSAQEFVNDFLYTDHVNNPDEKVPGTRLPVIDDKDYCYQSEGYYCSYEEVWRHDGGRILSHLSRMPMDYDGGPSKLHAECCMQNECWDAINEKCVAASIYDDPHKAPVWTQNSPDTGYRCHIDGSGVAQWTNRTKKYTPLRINYGYCAEGNNYCLMAGDPENEVVGSPLHCVPSGYEWADYRCEVANGQGLWVSRHRDVGLALMEVVGADNQGGIFSQDYTLYCGNYSDALNRIDYRVEGIEVYSPSINPISYFYPAHNLSNNQILPSLRAVEKVCVLKFGSEKTVYFGIALNRKPNFGQQTPSYQDDDAGILRSFLLYPNSGFNNPWWSLQACNDYVGQTTDDYFKCQYDLASRNSPIRGVWYNPQKNVVLVAWNANEQVWSAGKANLLSGFVTWFRNWIGGLVARILSLIQGTPFSTQDDIHFIKTAYGGDSYYIARKGTTSIYAYLEQHYEPSLAERPGSAMQQYVTINITSSSSSNICDTLQMTLGVNFAPTTYCVESPPGSGKFIVISRADSGTGLFRYWQNMTAALRPTG
jgi:hypothetical protein